MTKRLCNWARGVRGVVRTILAVFYAGWLTGPGLFGQDTPITGQHKSGVLSPQPPPLPPLPLNFRQLLATNAGGREQILGTRPEPKRETLRKNIRDYESLPPVEREARLCA